MSSTSPLEVPEEDVPEDEEVVDPWPPSLPPELEGDPSTSPLLVPPVVLVVVPVPVSPSSPLLVPLELPVVVLLLEPVIVALLDMPLVDRPDASPPLPASAATWRFPIPATSSHPMPPKKEEATRSSNAMR
jgi:hypothetical protein